MPVTQLVNLFADLDSRAMKSSSYFKAIVSGDAIDAEEKHKKPFFFRPFSRLIYSANELPPSYDTTEAYWRRWIIIPFPHSFRGKNAQKELKNWITTPEELSGLLNHALAGLYQLQEEQEFNETATIKEALAEYQRQNDPVKAFLDECCICDTDRQCERKLLFNAFDKFCNENGYKSMSNRDFYKKIRRLTEVYEKAINGHDYFAGVSLESF